MWNDIIKWGDYEFQRASCTLDGCVKIYEYSIATEIGNFLSGLAVSNDEDDGDDGDADPERRTCKKNIRSKLTLAKEYDSKNYNQQVNELFLRHFINQILF